MQIKVIPTIQRKSTNLTQPSQKMGNPTFGGTNPLRIGDVYVGTEPLKGQVGANIISRLGDLPELVRGKKLPVEDLMEVKKRCGDNVCKKLMGFLIDSLDLKEKDGKLIPAN